MRQFRDVKARVYVSPAVFARLLGVPENARAVEFLPAVYMERTGKYSEIRIQFAWDEYRERRRRRK